MENFFDIQHQMRRGKLLQPYSTKVVNKVKQSGRNIEKYYNEIDFSRHNLMVCATDGEI
jgi:hypothetical protein